MIICVSQLQTIFTGSYKSSIKHEKSQSHTGKKIHTLSEFKGSSLGFDL